MVIPAPAQSKAKQTGCWLQLSRLDIKKVNKDIYQNASYSFKHTGREAGHDFISYISPPLK